MQRQHYGGEPHWVEVLRTPQPSGQPPRFGFWLVTLDAIEAHGAGVRHASRVRRRAGGRAVLRLRSRARSADVTAVHARGSAGGMFAFLVAALGQGDRIGQQDCSSTEVAVYTTPVVGAATLHGAHRAVN